jgi:hypothetical protein
MRHKSPGRPKALLAIQVSMIHTGSDAVDSWNADISFAPGLPIGLYASIIADLIEMIAETNDVPANALLQSVTENMDRGAKMMSPGSTSQH